MKYANLISLLLLVNLLNGQTTFTKRIILNSSVIQEARRIIHTPDNKYLVVGYMATTSTGLDREGIVFKMDGSGTIEWAKSYGGSNWEEFYDVVQVGNFYYCVGYTRSFVKGIFPTTPLPPNTPPNVLGDVFLVKIKLDGTLVWAKNMGKTVNGTSVTDGNEIGYRLVPSGNGGVVILTRINAGSSTNQNSGMIWVESDGKTRWANQYDYVNTSANNNELTFSIWKDDLKGFITGGYVATFGTPTKSGGLIYKVNEVGDLAWDRNTRCSPGIFESLFYGYYNRKTGKTYSTDYYAQVAGSVREIQVCTNMANTGDVPSAGVKAMRYHYGLPGSSTNIFRSLIFPVGDGYEQFLMAANEITTAANNRTKYTTLLSVDEDLNLQWSKKIGMEHEVGSGNPGYLNQVYDMVPCDTSGSFLAVGTLSISTTRKEILLIRVGESSDTLACELSASLSDTSLTETATALNLTKSNLSCDTCFADNDLIPNASITVTNPSNTLITKCSVGERRGPPPGPEDDEISHIISNTVDGQSGLSELSFTFQKIPKEVYFEITDLTGDFVYERFWGNTDKLIQGIKLASLNMPKGEFVWEIEAIYEDEKGLERIVGEFKME